MELNNSSEIRSKEELSNVLKRSLPERHSYQQKSLDSTLTPPKLDLENIQIQDDGVEYDTNIKPTQQLCNNKSASTGPNDYTQSADDPAISKQFLFDEENAPKISSCINVLMKTAERKQDQLNVMEEINAISNNYSSAEDKELAQKQNGFVRKEKTIQMRGERKDDVYTQELLNSPTQNDVYNQEWISSSRQNDDYENNGLTEQNKLERQQQNDSTQETHSISVKLMSKPESKKHVELSPIPVKLTGLSESNDDEDYIPQHYYNRLMLQRRLHNSDTYCTIESCSGRRIEEAEVLKQKYINSEIQDIPRNKCTPFRSGRFIRNKSNHVNLASQDIRNQMNKIRLKTGSSVSDPVVDKVQNIRCKGIQKSAEYIINSDPFIPDYHNPELASLYDRYIKKCDQMTRQRAEAKKLLRELSRTGSDDSNDKSSGKLESDAQEAYLCGFLEGMQRNLNPPSCDASIQGKELVEEAEVHSLCSHSTNYREFISRTQDITHRPLREWEQQLRREKQRRDYQKRHAQTAFCNYCDQESKSRDHKKTSNLQEKLHTGVDLESKHVTDVHAYSALQSPTLSSLMKERMDELKYKAVDLSKLSKEDLDIVNMAKKKLEHKMLSSLEMEEMFLNRLKHKDVRNKTTRSNNSSPKSKSNKNNGKSGDAAKGSYIKFTTLDHLEGWETKSKHFHDHDILNVEWSDRLHPVDRTCEMFYSPLWAPCNSFNNTPLTSPRHKVSSTDSPKEEKLGKDSKETAGKDRIIISLPDLNDPKPSARKSKTDKSKQGLSTEFKKAADTVKLRLTNSSSIVEKTPDGVTVTRVLANVPLARCVSYNSERLLRASMQLAPNINLSDKLAQHLKQLSENPKAKDYRQRNNQLPSITPRVTVAHDSTADAGSPDISCSSNNVTGSTIDPSSAIQTGNTDVLHVIKSQNDEGGNRHTQEIPKQIRRYANAAIADKKTINCPTLSVKSLVSTKPDETTLKLAHQSESDKGIFQCGGVRVSNCTSSYMFNREDPQNLKLTARSLPPLHKVCTGCGRISAAQIDSDVGERRGIFKTGENYSELGRKQINPNFCELCSEEDKWTLDKQHTCTPEVNNTEKLMDNNTMSNDVPYISEQMTPRDMRSNLNPPQCKELSISFTDQNIKLRIQCELSVENTSSLGNGGRGESQCKSELNGCGGVRTGNGVKSKKEDSNIHQQSESWLERLAKPKNKNRLGCPVISETRIYRDNLKKSNKTEKYLAQPSPRAPAPTPYVEYCHNNHKTGLRTKRSTQTLKFLAAKVSATAGNDEVYEKSVSRKFKKSHIVPKQKSKEKTKRDSCGKNGKRKHPSGSSSELLIESTGYEPVYSNSIRCSGNKIPKTRT